MTKAELEYDAEKQERSPAAGSLSDPRGLSDHAAGRGAGDRVEAPEQDCIISARTGHRPATRPGSAVDERVAEFSVMEDPVSLAETLPIRKYPTSRLSFLIKPILVGLLALGADISASSGDSLFETGSIAGLLALAWHGAVSRFALAGALNSSVGCTGSARRGTQSSSDIRLGAASRRPCISPAESNAPGGPVGWTIADALRLQAARTIPAAAPP